MNFLEKFSDTKYVIRLNIKTNSKSQKIVNNNDFLTVFLKTKPVKNTANKELINLIKRKLNISSNQIQILSGSKSSDKLIKLTFSKNIEEQEIVRKLVN
ncbi:MAG: DUF167 domain-containing protein [Promethearchaeota archaeon]|nr:MAG: DUF167 domain-containing protein [Candidatus Lokiarchaeota archaeon]